MFYQCSSVVSPALENHASHFCFDKDTDTKRAWPGKFAETSKKTPQPEPESVQTVRQVERDPLVTHSRFPQPTWYQRARKKRRSGKSRSTSKSRKQCRQLK